MPIIPVTLYCWRYIETNCRSDDECRFSTPRAAKEREAIHGVLRRLHDADSLDGDAMNLGNGMDSPDRSNESNITADSESIAQAIAADNAMILLQATGDANQNAFDLAIEQADALDVLAAPLDVEPSVGLIQSLDVASDEYLSANGENQRIEPAVPLPEHGATSAPDNQPNRPLLHSATAIIGASALFGFASPVRDEQLRLHQRRYVSPLLKLEGPTNPSSAHPKYSCRELPNSVHRKTS